MLKYSVSSIMVRFRKCNLGATKRSPKEKQQKYEEVKRQKGALHMYFLLFIFLGRNQKFVHQPV